MTDPTRPWRVLDAHPTTLVCDEFGVDARLVLDGDFPSPEARTAYVERLLARLNGSPFRLKWTDPRPPGPACRYEHVDAESPLGLFRIEWKGWNDDARPCVYLNDIFIGVATTLDAAKAIAQEHVNALARALNLGDTE